MKKPSDDKKSKKAPKGKPGKGATKPETKSEATPPPPAKKPPKARNGKDDAPPPPPVAPAAAPTPAPKPDEPLHAGRQSVTASVLDDDPSRWLDGKSLHEKGKYLLNVCPKAKDSPALSCVSLRGQVAAATDERSCFWVDLGCAISESPLKVSRASFDAFMALLDGELKAAEKLDASVVVRWDGLVATIRREGEPEGRALTLEKFESGPDAEHFFLDAPEFAEGSHAMVTIERFRTAATWKGDGTAHIFVSPTARQLWVQFDVGGETFARAVMAFDGSNLGVRSPSLPMDMGGAKPKPAAPEPMPAAPEPMPATPAPAAETPVAPAPDLRSVIGAVHQIGPGMAWCCVVVDYSAAWERLRVSDINDLSPFVADDVRRVVVWGPYPRERARARLRYIVMRLSALHCDPRLVPCDAPDLMARALGAGEPTALGQLGDGTIDVEFEETPLGALGAGGGAGGDTSPAFPVPDTDVCASLDEATWEGLSPDERAELEALAEWDHEHSTQTLDAAGAAKLAEAMTRMGLFAAKVERVDDEGEDPITFWKVRRDTSATKGAASWLADAPFPKAVRPVTFAFAPGVWASLGEVTREGLVDCGPWGKDGSDVLGPRDAAVCATILARAGVRCTRVVTGEDVDVWTVDRAALPPGDVAAFPAPHAELPTVVEVPEAIWDALSEEQLTELHTPTKVLVGWFTGPQSTSSSTMAAPEARAVGALLASWGYRAEVVRPLTRYGKDVILWLVGPKGERGAAS